MSNEKLMPQKIKKNSVFVPYEIKKNSCYTYKHSGDIGDLIYSLPVMKFYGGGHLQLNPFGLPSKKYDGSKSGFDKKIIKFLKPLLERQEYIKSVTAWEKKFVDVDLDYFRTNPVESDNLCGKILGTFHVPFSETDYPWLTCEKKKMAPVVISRSFRYRNNDLNYSDLFENFKDCIFIGLPEEHEDFQISFGKIDYVKTDNLLQISEIINGSELFIGNQSAPMAIAIGLHKAYLQEYYPSHPDCVFPRTNGKYLFTNKEKQNANIS